MIEGKARQSVKNVFVNISAKMIMMLLPFFIRSVMIYTLGNIYLGLDSLFSSILNMLSLSELGFSSAIVYAMYKPIAENDDIKVRALLTFYKKIYFIVGSIIIGVGLILLPNLEMFIAKGTEYPKDINIHIVYLILLFNTGISYFLYAYKSSVFIATMRNDLDAIIELIRSLISHGLQIFALLIFKNYYLYILILPCITVLNNLYRSHVVDQLYPQYKGQEHLSKEDKKDIMTRVGALIGNKIGGVVFTSVDSIVISAVLGLEVLGKYTNYYTIFTAVYAVGSTAYTAIQSTVGNSLICRTKEENYSLFRKLFTGNAIISCFCTCCFVFLYQPFMRLWVGNENVLDNSIPVLLALYFWVKSTRRICFLFKEAAGMWREDWLKPYISVLLNVTLNIYFAKTIGLPGVILSSVIALIVVEIPWETVVFFRKYFEKNIFPYLKEIFKSAVITILAVAFIWILSYKMNGRIENDIMLICVRMGMCVITTGCLYFPTYRKNQIKKL
nr:oligosaccharide flippase family protein [uncultured Sellimonas sp.]